MISKASVNHIRISPRKVRYVIDLLRAKSVTQAQAILSGSPRRARDIVQKLLNQALDAAQRNSQVGAKDLMISKILADGGPSMKRFRAATMGRANRIKKRTSHIQLELDLSKKAAAAQLKALETSPNLSKRYKAVSKALGMMEKNLRHPSLNTHKYDSLFGAKGEDIFESYAENNTPAAYRIFWHYGPAKEKITVIAITNHP